MRRVLTGERLGVLLVLTKDETHNEGFLGRGAMQPMGKVINLYG